jgi:hypothetical protein
VGGLHWELELHWELHSLGAILAGGGLLVVGSHLQQRRRARSAAGSGPLAARPTPRGAEAEAEDFLKRPSKY